MTESDLVSSDHFDGNNPIGSVVEKMQIGKGKEWNCRFKMTMLTDEIEVEMLGQEQQNKKKRSAPQKNKTPVKKKKKQRNDAPSLWEIYDLNPQEVAPKVAKCGFSKRTFLAEEVAHFFLFVHERQEIWEGRNRGDAAPWSKSKAMTDYFFCNVRTYTLFLLWVEDRSRCCVEDEHISHFVISQLLELQRVGSRNQLFSTPNDESQGSTSRHFPQGLAFQGPVVVLVLSAHE